MINKATMAALVGLLLSGAAAGQSNPDRTADDVLPCRVPEQKDPKVREVQDRIYQLSMHQARYVLTLVHPWSDDPTLKLTTESKSIEHYIRPNAGAITLFAFLYRFGPYDEKVVGISRKELLNQNILPMMRYLAVIHVTSPRTASDGKRWGDHWQSTHWAQMLTRAAWWIWDDVPADLRADLRRIVAHEAARFVNETPPHQVLRDTKSEENAWNSMIFDIAMVVMPSDPQREAWARAFQRWSMSAYLRPADERSAEMVDGQPVSEQFLGANIYDDFTLENHDRVHPDYMGAFGLKLTCALDYAMSGRRAPEAVFHNVQPIYDNLKWMFLPSGGCVYPNGEDWELFNASSWTDLHTQLAVFYHDPDAWSLMLPCLATAEKMQARHPSGAIYRDEQLVYDGAQQLIGDEFAREWLTLQCADRIVDRPAPRMGVKRFDQGKLIIHRTPRAVHTLSWGVVVMAQCVPMRVDQVVSPHQRSGVGRVRLRDDRRDLPVSLVSAEVTDSADGFTAKLVLDHGQAIRAELQVTSGADGTMVMRERLRALQDCETTELATGLIGILNNTHWVYETGKRRIRFDEVSTDIPARSGRKIDPAEAKRITVDEALEVKSDTPLRASYRGATRLVGGRATDELYLNDWSGPHTWKTGQTISTYEVRVSPVER